MVNRTFAAVVVLLCGINNFAGGYEVIKNPQPTHIETPDLYKNLKLIKTISGDFEEEYFLAQPSSIAVDVEGSFFVFDNKLQKIFKFDKDLEFVKAFGTTGRGPGEYVGVYYDNKRLRFSWDGKLYLSDPLNKKFIVYDRSGNHKKDLAVPIAYSSNVLPLVDNSGNIYLPTRFKEKFIEVYDRNLKPKYKLLDKDDYTTFVMFKPFPGIIASHARPGTTNTYYDLVEGDKLLAYIVNSSTVYIFSGNKLERKYHLFPKRHLEFYKSSFENVLADSKEKDWHIDFCNSLFVDSDDRNYFYMDGPTASKDKKNRLLCKFNIAGKLTAIYQAGYDRFNPDFFKAKGNRLFFSIALDGDIMIYKEEK